MNGQEVLGCSRNMQDIAQLKVTNGSVNNGFTNMSNLHT
jgi:hypothetical protein